MTIAGFGCTSYSLLSTIYINEISEPAIRGGLGHIMSLMFGAGVLWDNSVGAAFGEQWVIFTGVMLATPVVLVVTVLFITETPYYLVIRGKEEKAAESLEWLRGPGSGNVKAELQSIKTTVEEEKKRY